VKATSLEGFGAVVISMLLVLAEGEGGGRRENGGAGRVDVVGERVERHVEHDLNWEFTGP
jgi:hypothetical protein